MSSVQYIDNSERDKIFKDLKKINQNNKCIVCEKKCEWASINLSIFLCFDCSGKHRQFGPKLSLVRSIDLDYWTPKQILFMEQGGNQKFLDYMRKNGVISGNNRQIDWENNQVVKRYKAELARVIEGIEAKKNNKSQPQKEVVKEAVVEQVVEQKQESDKKPEEEEEKVDIFNNNLQKPTKVKTSNVVFASKKGNKKGGKKIKAEKIDDFDWDSLALDDGVNQEDQKKKENKFMDFKLYEEEQQEKEDNNDDFFAGSSNNNNNNNNGWGSSNNNNSKTNEDASKNFNEMKSKNTNAISSAALFGSQETSNTDKQKFNQFSGSGGISSDQFFDRQTSEEQDQGFDTQQHVENIKSFFWNVGEVVKKTAKDLNEKYGNQQ